MLTYGEVLKVRSIVNILWSASSSAWEPNGNVSARYL